MGNLTDQLAILGKTDFEQLYPTADEHELTETWRTYCGGPEDIYQHTKLVLGTLGRVSVTPSVFVSVDLCEVVRGTHLGIRGFEELPGTNPHKEPYGYDMRTIELVDGKDEHERRQRQIQHILDMGRTLINADLIEPDPYVSGIAALLRNWRKMGAYVFANTATGEGCEAGTVRFLGKHLPGAFDGIVFSRNYDSSQPVKKGTVAREVVDMVSSGPASVIHIDDSEKHLSAFAGSFGVRPDTAISTYQVRYAGVTEHAESLGSLSPVGTFAMVDRQIRDELVKPSLPD